MKILEVERVILRELVETDGEFMLDLLNQPSFIKYIGDRNVRSVEAAREFIENRYRASYRVNGYGLWAVEAKETGAAMGICGFVKRDSLPDADIGFAFLPQFEGKGYALEAAVGTMKYGAETLNLRSVLAITSTDNEKSGKLLGKLGFSFEGLIKLGDDAEQVKLFAWEAGTPATRGLQTSLRCG